MLSTIGAALYLAVSALCLWAALRPRREEPGLPARRAIWLAIAALFVALAASRLANFEEHFRNALRLWLMTEGQYEERRAVQGPLAAALVAIAGLAALLAMVRPKAAGRDPRSRALVWAQRATGAMIGLVALRLVSFHPTDALLYEAKLNWVIDPALSVIVGLCAWRFIQAPAPRRGSAA